MDNYQRTIVYSGLGWAVGRYMISWTPSARISPQMFWSLAGAGAGLWQDSAEQQNNPKRTDHATFNYTTPYQGVS